MGASSHVSRGRRASTLAGPSFDFDIGVVYELGRVSGGLLILIPPE